MSVSAATIEHMFESVQSGGGSSTGAPSAGPAVAECDAGAVLVEQIVRLERAKAVLEARVLALVAELADQVDGWVDQRDARIHDRLCGAALAAAELAPAELAPALRMAPVTAAFRVDRACRLRDRLPLTLAAMGRGELDLGRVLAIDEATRPLAVDAAGRVERMVLPRAVEQTAGELRAALRRAVIVVDPNGAEERRRVAVRGRRVSRYAREDGTSALEAVLSAVDTGEIYDLVDEVARRAAGPPGDDRSMDARRADALVRLVLGRDPHLGPTDPPPPPACGTGPDGFDDPSPPPSHAAGPAGPGAPSAPSPTSVGDPDPDDLPDADLAHPPANAPGGVAPLGGSRAVSDEPDLDERFPPEPPDDLDERFPPARDDDLDERFAPEPPDDLDEYLDGTAHRRARDADRETDVTRRGEAAPSAHDPFRSHRAPDAEGAGWSQWPDAAESARRDEALNGFDVARAMRAARISDRASRALSAMTPRRSRRLRWVTVNPVYVDGTTVAVGELDGYGPITHQAAEHLLAGGACRAPGPAQQQGAHRRPGGGA